MAMAAGAALRLRLLCRMLRVGELLALAVLLFWSSSRVPSAAAAVLRLAGSLLLNARFVFVLGNAIVLLLLALSRRDPSLSSATNHHAIASSGAGAGAAQTAAVPAAASFPSFVAPTTPTSTPTPTPMPASEASAVAAPVALVVPATATVFEEDKPAPALLRINKARAPRRSRSEKMGPRVGAMRAASPELRRSESDNGRRRRSSVTARDVAGGCWGMDDAEEFRRTVEAFIAKQTRFHREEESMTTVVAGAGYGEVAGALVVVE